MAQKGRKCDAVNQTPLFREMMLRDVKDCEKHLAEIRKDPYQPGLSKIVKLRAAVEKLHEDFIRGRNLDRSHIKVEHAELEMDILEWRPICDAWWRKHKRLPIGVADLFVLAEPHMYFRSKVERGQRVELGVKLPKLIGRVFGSWMIRDWSPDPITKAMRYRLTRIDDLTPTLGGKDV